MYSRWTSESPIGQESGILLSQKHVSWVEAHMLLVECMEIYIYIKSYTHILIGPYPWSIGGQMHGCHTTNSSNVLLLYDIKQIGFVLLCTCSVVDHKRLPDMVRSVRHSVLPHVPLFSFLAHFVDIWDLHVLLKRIAKGRGAPHFVSCRKSGVL